MSRRQGGHYEYSPIRLKVWYLIMPHLRSPEKRKQRREAREARRERLDKEHGVLMQFSHRDYYNGEIMHTVKTEPIVYEKIKLLYGDGFSMVCANLEYGEVLNRVTFFRRP